jgi:hypothetical protein
MFGNFNGKAHDCTLQTSALRLGTRGTYGRGQENPLIPERIVSRIPGSADLPDHDRP